MNHNKRNTERKQPDCFKPWQSHRNKSPSPCRRFKNSSIIHHINVTDNNKSSRQNHSSKRNNYLHDVFVNHLRCQLPKAANHPQFYTKYKERKDNQNENIQNHSRNSNKHEIIYPKLKYNRKNYVSFEDDYINDRLYSSSETNLSTNYSTSLDRNQSIRNVIEKFNKLSTNIDNYMIFKTSKTQKQLAKNYYTEKDNKVSEEFIPVDEVKEKINEEHKNKINNKILRRSGTILRSQRKKNVNKDYTIHCDDLLEIFKPSNEAEKKDKKSVPKIQEQEAELYKKNFVSIHTQTTPHCSATNIMINVYKEKYPQSKQLQTNSTSLEIQIEDNNKPMQNNSLENHHTTELTKQSVKSCIEKFEENLKKNGIEFEKDMSGSKIFSKIRSNMLLKNQNETLLSARPSSVPF